MKLITYDRIKELEISPGLCYEWVSDMIAAKNSTSLPPKISMHPSDGVFCNVMPCMIPDGEIANTYGGVKIVNRYPERKPSLDSKLMLMDMRSGEFLALMDANWITAMRTGAVAVHSMNLFAKKTFEVISLIGLGNTARATILVLTSLYPNREFTVKLLKYKGQEVVFAQRFEEYPNLHFEYEERIDSLVRGADVVVSCATYFENDICADECFDEGVLVIPVHTRGFSNCDLFFDKVYADDRGHVCHFRNFDKFKFFAETCEVVNNKVKGRESDKERILAYNIGLAIHDINYAAHIYQMICQETELDEIDLCAPTEKFWV